MCRRAGLSSVWRRSRSEAAWVEPRSSQRVPPIQEREGDLLFAQGSPIGSADHFHRPRAVSPAAFGFAIGCYRFEPITDWPGIVLRWSLDEVGFQWFPDVGFSFCAPSSRPADKNVRRDITIDPEGPFASIEF